MNKHSWMTVGIKLIGVYFVVLGVIGLLPTGLSYIIELIGALFQEEGTYARGFGEILWRGGVGLFRILLYLVVGVLLVKWTAWCVKTAGVEEG